MKARSGYAARWLVGLLLIASCSVVPSAASAQDEPTFSQQQLDQLLAPIALYPDQLLSQMLMAATYPLEVAEAARWSRNHPDLQGDDAVRAVAEENWDPSVKSLVAFPQVLAWMDENPEWLRTLGDAFLSQEPQVMETVQNLRRRAQASGTLSSDDRIRVVEDAQAISVLPANPQIVYVPYYDPMVAYGTWWWPAYPPVYWRTRPGYVIRPGYTARFYWGPAISVSRGFFFGACDWRRRQVRVVNVNTYYYRTAIVNRPVNVGVPTATVNPAPGVWRHDPMHRRGIAYRGPAAQRFLATSPAERHEFRRDDPIRPRQLQERRGASTQFATPPRSDAPVGARPSAGSAAAQTIEARPEPQLAPPAATVPSIQPREPARASEIRPELRRAQPPAGVPAVQPREATRATEIRPEARGALPAAGAPAAQHREAPRGRQWQPEAQSARPVMRFDSGTRFEPPQSVAPRADSRAAAASPAPAPTGAKADGRNRGHRDPERSSGHRGRSEGREGGRGAAR